VLVAEAHHSGFPEIERMFLIFCKKYYLKQNQPKHVLSTVQFFVTKVSVSIFTVHLHTQCYIDVKYTQKQNYKLFARRNARRLSRKLARWRNVNAKALGRNRSLVNSVEK